MRVRQAVWLGVTTLLAIPACSSQQLASKVRLPATVLAQGEPTHVVTQTERIDPRSLEPSGEQPSTAGVRSVIMPTSPSMRTSDETSPYREDSAFQRYESPVSSTPREHDNTLSSANDLSATIQQLLNELDRNDPQQAQKFAEAVREASGTERLPQVIAAWQATAGFMSRNNRTQWKNEPSIAGNADRTQAADWPRAPQSFERPAEQPAVYVDQRPPDRQVADRTSYKPDYNESPGVDGTRRIQYQAQPPATELTLPIDAGSPAARPMPSSASLHTNKDMATQLRELAWQLQGSRPETASELLKNQVNSRLLYAISGDDQQALSPIDGVDPLDRDYWQHLIRSQLAYFETRNGTLSPDRFQEVGRSLDKASETIQQRSPLRLQKPLLCRKVNNYGNFEEFEDYRFPRGEKVVVYWEVANFQSVPTPKGFRTSMDATFEIFDTNGQRRHQSRHPFTDDYCQTMRSDYFNAVLFQFPGELSSGDYILKVTLHDKSSDKVAESQCQFTIN